MKRLDLTGQRFHYLTAVRYMGDKRWEFRCDCGSLTVQRTRHVRHKTTPVKSCGCMRGRLISASRTTHGMTRHPAYGVWRSMVDRCTLPTHRAWPRYGGRGITLVPEWVDSFEAFWADMGATYQKGLTLDRADNNAGYTVTNCRWVSRRVQARNTRSNRMIDTPKGRMLMIEAAEISGIAFTTLAYRVTAGVPTARLFDPPSVRNRFTTS